jgi:hypothetical protein
MENRVELILGLGETNVSRTAEAVAFPEEEDASFLRESSPLVEGIAAEEETDC